MDRIELLSPAKDLDTGVAAINCGADAVYVGAARFGARESAGNSLPDLQALIDYAHRYYAKIYVTVNTLLTDAELPAAEELIQRLYDMGADALIIQDAGLLELDLPPIPLFASTQMHNHTPEKVAFLEKVGFQRVILARELTLDQIREIRTRTNIELETFIHGALCVSYSGQCYLSYALGGRSGNRGQCAQPCRRLYRLVGADGRVVVKDRYLLSLRDLNQTESLADLVKAGVCSFKIEGRLKDKAYVMNVTAHYRQQLDAILSGKGWQKASSGQVTFDFKPDPAKTFNRGFTSYFLHGRGAPIASPDTPKWTGEPVGRVKRVSSRGFTLESSLVELHPGDGLCYFDHNKELRGMVVNQVNGLEVTVERYEGLHPGMRVYRNHDHAFLNALEKSRTERKIRVDMAVSVDADELRLGLEDEDGVKAFVVLPGKFAAAENPENARAVLERGMRKLGGTEFTCCNFQVNWQSARFVPVATANELRRQGIVALAQARQTQRKRPEGGARVNRTVYPVYRLDFTGNVLNRMAEQFYRRHGVEQIEPAAEAGLNLRGRRVMTTKLCLRFELGACLKQKDRRELPPDLSLVDEQGNLFPLRFNCADCVMEIIFAGKTGSKD
ncbi:MAG TPA: U32 family peptidase [Anaerolineaceae bacterium]